MHIKLTSIKMLPGPVTDIPVKRKAPLKNDARRNIYEDANGPLSEIDCKLSQME